MATIPELNKSLINKSKQALKEIPFSKITVELYHFNLTYFVRFINFKVEMVYLSRMFWFLIPFRIRRLNTKQLL